MTRDEVKKVLEAKIEELRLYPPNAKFICDIERIKELSKCPKCKTYSGDGFITKVVLGGIHINVIVGILRLSLIKWGQKGSELRFLKLNARCFYSNIRILCL